MKIKKETIIRVALLVLALVNQGLEYFGHRVLPVTDNQLAELIGYGFIIITSLWAMWKNNSFTTEAKLADKYLEELKEGE